MPKIFAVQEKMIPSDLFQILRAPIGRVDDLSFGGGIKNGGFSDEVMDVLVTIFHFEWMGSAEYEYGQVAAAFNFLREQARLGRITFGEFDGVYYICPSAYESGVKEVIEKQFGLESSNRHSENLGLFEISNGFLLFFDKKMFENTQRALEYETRNYLQKLLDYERLNEY